MVYLVAHDERAELPLRHLTCIPLCRGPVVTVGHYPSYVRCQEVKDQVREGLARCRRTDLRRRQGYPPAKGIWGCERDSTYSVF